MGDEEDLFESARASKGLSRTSGYSSLHIREAAERDEHDDSHVSRSDLGASAFIPGGKLR